MQLNNPKQFTEKAWQAISRTPDIAKASQNPHIETEHLMKALLEQNGVATSLFNKAGVSTTKVQEYTETFIYHPPKVKNKANNIYLETVCQLIKTSLLRFERLINRLLRRGGRRARFLRFIGFMGYFSNNFLGRSLDNLLDNAEKYRQEYTDEYISIEHLILAYLKDDRFGKNLYQELQLDEAKLKEIISQVRGNQKVTDKNPEDKYEALEKYRRDELAKYLEQLQEAKLEYEAVEAANSYTSRFLAKISHELSLLRDINEALGYSDLLYKEAEDLGYDDFLPDLKIIELNGTHLLEMISDILDIYKIEPGQVTLYLESIEVNKLVQDVVGTAKNLTEKKRNKFKLVLGENLGTMYADVWKVKQVLRNLLSNAAKFTKDGEITLSVEKVKNRELNNLQNQNSGLLNKEQNYIVFRVIDTGIGMREEQLKDIFEPFNWIYRIYGGTGLELAICQRLCEMIGAKIEVESKYGEGSTFTVWFPERMNETLRFGNNDQDLKLDEAKLQETISQVKKLTDKNFEDKYETSEIYTQEELLRYIKQFQEAKLKAAEAANLSKSAFLANISNELRYPLKGIISYSNVLYEEAMDEGYEDFIISDLKQINLIGLHVLERVQDISDISKIEAGQVTLDLENIEVNKLVKDVVGILEPLCKKKRNTFQLVLGENLGTMYADRSKVKQVLINLLANAAKFTEDGEITLSVERVNNQKLQNIHHQGAESLNNAQSYIVFRVIDTGIGMTEEQLKDIFKPFNRIYGRTGLGLAICKGLCERMGAKITVESKYGEGSTFTVEFPERVMI
ncbi:MAG: ATP-binding protein [Trichodesmium sp.]